MVLHYQHLMKLFHAVNIAVECSKNYMAKLATSCLGHTNRRSEMCQIQHDLEHECQTTK